MSDAEHLDFGLNAILQLQQQGYDHYALLMQSREQCQQAALLLPKIGCIWSSFAPATTFALGRCESDPVRR
jgi:hypothetical protein